MQYVGECEDFKVVASRNWGCIVARSWLRLKIEIDDPHLNKFIYNGHRVISFSSNALALSEVDIQLLYLYPSNVETHIKLIEFLENFLVMPKLIYNYTFSFIFFSFSTSYDFSLCFASFVFFEECDCFERIERILGSSTIQCQAFNPKSTHPEELSSSQVVKELVDYLRWLIFS